MDEFPGLLARDFGFQPQGNSAPMSAAKSASVGGVAGLNLGSGSARFRSRSGSSTGDSLLGGGISENRSPPGYDDVFGGPPRYSNSSHGRSVPSSSSPASYDSIFDGFKDSAGKSSLPVYDKPVYDDDIFDGIPGITSSSSVKYEDVFSSMATNHGSSPPYDDLLENLGRTVPEPKGSVSKRYEEHKDQDLSAFDELIPGFGGSSPPKKRETQETKQQSAAPSDPFGVLETTSTSAYPSSGLFTAPLKPMNSGSTKVESSPDSRGIFDDNAFDELTKSTPLFKPEMNQIPKDKIPLKTEKEPPQRSTETFERNAMEDQFPKSYEHLETADDVWLSVAEIPLSTRPSSVPPPSRSPPPIAIKQAQFGKTDHFSSVGLNAKRKDNESLQFTQSFLHMKNSVKKSGVSLINDLEDFAMGNPQRYAGEHAEALTGEEENEMNSAAAASAAAMKEAMDRAEAKFKQAREVRERERDAKSSRSRESTQQEREEKAISDARDLEDIEMLERLDREQEQRESEEKEEQKRRENERAQVLQRERERDRQAVERATREARERAAAEARLRAERAAVDKVNTEARQRAERAAVQRATTEARGRAAVDAKDRAERAAVDARERAERAAAAEAREKADAVARERAAVERAAVEARLRSERAAVDRANTEARGRAAAEARERATRGKQHKAENDFGSLFNMDTRPNSTPKQRATTSESVTKEAPDGKRRSTSSSSFTVRKEPFSTIDDLTSMFGAPPSSEQFQEVEGETEERRRARLDRHQRTIKRVEEALATKNERDMQAQRDQAERHRIAETLDIEIKRWSAGKEGNLRALLSTLQYVLWPECGWQPISLTDLITGASVKKVYRKATLCIHPDKVQQKGANLQQKYIAEKVFDLLKEAWNKFNSEELF